MLVTIDGVTPTVDSTAFVAPTASVIGRVSLAANSSVFYGAVLRGDIDSISIGAGSNVQDNVSMHTDVGIKLVVGSGVSIGHNAVVHGCTVEDDCLIGMGAIILNHAVIGAGSLVAAGAVVLEGTVDPARFARRRRPGQGSPRTHRRGARAREGKRGPLCRTRGEAPRPACMTIRLDGPGTSDLPSVIAALREWQDDAAAFQLHPGDLGWFARFGEERMLEAVRTWSRDDRSHRDRAAGRL